MSSKSALLKELETAIYTMSRMTENYKKKGKAKFSRASAGGRLEDLKDLWTRCQVLNAEVETTFEESERLKIPYFANKEFERAADVYYESCDYFREISAELTEPPTNSAEQPAGSGKSGDKLPPVDIQPFDGDYGEWPSFRDHFQSIVGRRSDLSQVTKLHYLLSCVKGDALDVIRDIELSNTGYASAWEALVETYESERRQITTLLNRLLHIPYLKSAAGKPIGDIRALVRRTVRSLSSITGKSEFWDGFLLSFVLEHLDPETQCEWNDRLGTSKEFPRYSEFDAFLEHRATTLQYNAAVLKNRGNETTTKGGNRACSSVAVNSGAGTDSGDRAPKPNNGESATACPLCRVGHPLRDCPKFVGKSVAQRREIAARVNACYNCLGANHVVAECGSRYRCKKCRAQHHTLLHAEPAGSSKAPTRRTTPDPNPTGFDHAASACLAVRKPMHSVSACNAVLLKTAVIRVYGEAGRSATVRALIDEGSQVTLITEQLAGLLHLRRERSNLTITTAGGGRLGAGRHAATISLSPVRADTSRIEARGQIVPNLVGIAKQRVDTSALTPFKGLRLADDDPTSSRRLDVLIGADVCNWLFRKGVKYSRDRGLKVEKTIFGWVLSGVTGSRAGGGGATHGAVGCVTAIRAEEEPPLAEELRRFWEIEEISVKPAMSPLDAVCEEHFAKTHSRTPEGRFVVRLPFRQSSGPEVGESRVIAARRFRSLVKKLARDAVTGREYSAFMREYEEAGHMCRAPGAPPREVPIYIPHHPVLRADSKTTRLRVVFDASCRTENGRSLNDCLLPGPKLQTDLPTVLLRWRQHRCVYSADIEKMYRQIRVHREDVDFQRILWAPRQGEEPAEYRLQTVTYGLNCAPYLALRVLRELTSKDEARFPLAAPVMRQQTYVDDVLFGEESIGALKRTRDDVVGLLKGGGFRLRKWASNSPELLADLDEADHGLSCTRELAEDERVKILGIAWHPRGDSFSFNVTPPSTMPTTKRSILSVVARFYDPLGWVTPVIVAAKVLLQELWRANVDWDDALPAPLRERWGETYRGLSSLREISLPRWTGGDSTSRRVELHGFADASSSAYAAVTYLRVTRADGTSIVTLLAGKSRVAPVKPVTIPRLELCAASLLARLIEMIQETIGTTVHAIHCWSDSTVVLAWLRDHPSRWQTFVANRVQEIRTRIPEAEWRHVPTADNPADCASRGLTGQQLPTFSLWWNGPRWLASSPDLWPRTTAPPSADAPLEERRRLVLATTRAPLWDLPSRFSSWPKLLRVTALLFRFIRRCRREPPDPDVPVDALGADEVARARDHWMRTIQAELFREEVSALEQGRAVRASSPLSALNPFLGPGKIIRVGGRLKNAALTFSQRHPIVVGDHRLVRMMIANVHQRTLHRGPQLTLCTLRREYWVLRARSLVRAVIHRCVRCVRERAKTPTQLMGQLPAPRVTRSIKTFDHTGVDYAGPIRIRASTGRGIATRKAYIAVFVCLATRAIHLELVADLSTEAFLRAFARFTSRRGLPSTVYSDNGTTFVGADRELARSYRATIRNADARNQLAGDGVTWKFIPPNAPHFGGLWEAGVRSVKFHLRRILGDHKLTFEEFVTLLCRVEACLNSRPIAPLSDAIDDFDALTPGHFLVGHPLTSGPEPTLLDVSENRLSRWQLVRVLCERFWKRWRDTYLNTLQQRNQWRTRAPSLKIGQLILLRTAAQPPCKWAMGRILEVHPGADGLVRVVTVKTADSVFERPITQLCVLPVDQTQMRRDDDNHA